MEGSKCSSTEALDEISRRLHAGHFTSQFDAMCLASVELDCSAAGGAPASPQHTSASISTPQSGAKPLRGLQGLHSEILGVLNSAVIAEQGTLGYLQQQIDQLQMDQLRSTPSSIQQLQGTASSTRSVSSSPGKSVSTTTASKDMEWNSLPRADDDHDDHLLVPRPLPLPLNPSAQVLEARRAAPRRRLQLLYDEVFELLVSKTQALEAIDALLGAYEESIARLAAASGLQYTTQRAQFVTQSYLQNLLAHRFLDTAQPKAMMRTLQAIAGHSCLRGHADLAKCRLALDYQSTQEANMGVDVLSLKKGAVAVLLLWAMSECFNNEQEGGEGVGRDIWKDPTFSIFVCLGDLTLLLWLWGASICVWRRAGIDYLHLLSLQKTDLAALCRPLGDFSSPVPERAVFQSATDLSLVYLLCFVVFNKTLRGSFSREGERQPAIAHAIPSCLLLWYAARFFSPWLSLLASRRTWLRMLWKVLAAPYYTVQFRDGYIGDLLTSLVRVSVSLSFSLIYLLVELYSWLTNDLAAVQSERMSPWWQRSYLYRFQLVPFLTLLPLWLRLMQCIRRSLESGQRWPHLFNALKYGCAIMVFSFGVLHPDLQQNGVWITCLCAATCYQFIWDITMDWGLLQLRVEKGHGSRRGGWGGGGRVSVCFRPEQQLTLGPRWMYYAVIGGNFVLRFAWAITYVPREIHAYSPVSSYVFNNFQTVMAATEIVRRMVWGFLRLEWEHIQRTGAAPVSLSRQHGLVREAGALSLSKGGQEGVVGGGGDFSFSMDSGTEMTKMGIGSGYDHSKGGMGRFADLFSYNAAAVEHTSPSKDEDEEGPSPQLVAMKSGSSNDENGGGDGGTEEDGDDGDDGDMVMSWLLSWLPFDVAANFPFFLFEAGLDETVRSYPRHRFRLRVVEGAALTIFVLGVMSVSALTKMHSAGYI